MNRKAKTFRGQQAGSRPTFGVFVGAFLSGILATATACAQESAATGTPAAPAMVDPYKSLYDNYRPDYVEKIDRSGGNYNSPFRYWKKDEEQMKLSSEPTFFTLNVLDEDSRANALVEAGLKKEQDGQFREALKVYQEVIEKFPRVMYRVSQHGVFVPVSQYCQRRILQFPPPDLAHYRTLHDARAREAFEQARRQYSLLGLSDIVDEMLATSYGGPAMLELGGAALDAGNFLAALEYFTTVRDYFPDRNLKTPELYLKIAYCEKMLGVQPGPVPSAEGSRSELTFDQFQRLEQVVAASRYQRPPFHSQRTSEPSAATDDYTLLPPPSDPLAIESSTWQHELPGTRHDFFVYTQPVVTDNSVVYRHKNIVYCRSLLNGELRWTNDLGGRAGWQNWYERMYPQEDVLVQDGLVFTVMNKAGPSLIALDEVTGNLRWAYGPLAASTEEESRMRFEAAPTGGPRTVFAGYVLDNIEGETHTDSEYGVIAFDSATGRIHWRTPLCRLAPGKFAGGFAETRRNKIRSFTSPPLYHQGTVYYNTNAGAVAALDGLSGRVKWLTRYPYYPEVHDATRQFGQGGEVVQHTRIYFRPHNPMFWYNQRPLLSGERLIVPPVDSNMLFCFDRRTGKVHWSTIKAGDASAYLLGMTADDRLAVAYSGRNMDVPAQRSTAPIHLIDPATGQTEWSSPDLIVKESHPVMTHYVFASPSMHFRTDEAWWEMSARPVMTSDGRVYVSAFHYVGYPIYGWFSNLAVLDLNAKKIVSQRRYFSGEILNRADVDIRINGPEELAAYEAMANKDDVVKSRIALLKDVVADTVPENEYGPFMPFSRITLQRYGVPFELRISPRTIEMVYDTQAVTDAIAARKDPEADFARAELLVAENRLTEAAGLLDRCLATISSEDVDFRLAINQQLYRVHQRLAQRAVRAAVPEDELPQCLGMSRTASTLAEEIETLFAVADAYQRKGDYPAAARALRTIIATYGHHEYPVPPVVMADAREVLSAAGEVVDRYRDFTGNTLFGAELTQSLALMKRGLPLYMSAVSPLPRTFTVRAEELASFRLAQLQQLSSEFSDSFRKLAQDELSKAAADEIEQRLKEFPKTPAAQAALAGLFDQADKDKDITGRRQLWRLADIARVGGLRVPDKFGARLSGGADRPDRGGVALPPTPRPHEFTEEEEAARLVLERHGDHHVQPQLLFLGTRLRKRLYNKFVLTAMDLRSGGVAWQTDELRLKGKGNEPGFFTAHVHGDLVIVHGLYDVLAFTVADGKPRWHYQAPFDFEIKSAVLSGDLLLLAGQTETLALYVPTTSENGELAWQVSELGDTYIPPYFRGDRMISVRKLPFNVTVRYRTTGRLIGRLDLPDLSLLEEHPLVENGPADLPVAHSEELLMVTDGWYAIMIDTDRIAVRWKWLIDNNDVTREPPMRFYLSDRHALILKQDYDQKVIYMLSSHTGQVLWQTDPKDVRTPQAMHSVVFAGDACYGIMPHPGQGFYFVGRDCETGKELFKQEIVGYQAKPEVILVPQLYGQHLVARIADRQDFQLRALDIATGKSAAQVDAKGVGPFGVHGRISFTVQDGRLVLLSKNNLSL